MTFRPLTHGERIVREVSSLEAELIDKEAKIAELEQESEMLRSAADSYRDEAYELSQQISTLEHENQSLSQQIASLEEALADACFTGDK